MDVDRFNDSLRASKWREVRQALGDTYEVQPLYEGPLPGLPKARITRLSSGDPDSPARVLIDAVPTSVSRPVLVAGRAVTRVFTSRARERVAVLDHIALRIHVVELDAEAAEIPPLPLASGLDGGLHLAHSVSNHAAWAAVSESVSRFRPTFALDLRDAGAAVPNAHLALVLHGQTHAADVGVSAPHAGATEAGAIAHEVRRRGITPYAGSPAERATAGLRLLSDGALTRTSSRDPLLSTASAASGSAAAVGMTALALGMRELDRAIALVESVAAGIDQSIKDFRPVAA